MTNTRSVARAKAPWRLWVVGILAVLWNAVGVLDYLMTETRNASYMSVFTPEQLAYFNGLPKWIIATWAIGVWGGLLGSLLILLQRRRAVQVLTVSLLSAAVTFFYNFVLSDGLRVMGGAAALLMPAVVIVVAILLLIYSRQAAQSGRLR
ncbi:MAG: hypothetical protein ACKOB4_14620 [Acidobacteriota bacterium]